MDLQAPRFLPTSSRSRTSRRTALRGLTAGGLAAGLLGAVGLRGNTPATRAAQALTDPNLSFEYSGRSSIIGSFEYSGP